MTDVPGSSDEPTYESLLAETVRSLTAAARLTRLVGTAESSASREPIDWAEFVTQALVGAAANVGGVEQILSGRPGSWEADGVRQLLVSTVGEDDDLLLRYRTEPVVVDLYVEEILSDADTWKAYDASADELYRRQEEKGFLNNTEPLTEEQEHEADALADLEEQLEAQRVADWAAYGEALRAQVEAAAARRPGLQVPVVVRVDLDTLRSGRGGLSEFVTIAEELVDEALRTTPLPGGGRDPLQRLEVPGSGDGADADGETPRQ